MFKNRTDIFRRLLDSMVQSSLPLIGAEVVSVTNEETPVATGNLKKNNKYSISEGSLYIYNPKKYAPYVEFGTFKQAPNPFMRRGIMKSKESVLNIFKKELSV